MHLIYKKNAKNVEVKFESSFYTAKWIEENDGDIQYEFSKEIIDLAKTITFKWALKNYYYGGLVSPDFKEKNDLIEFVEEVIPLGGDNHQKFKEARELYQYALLYVFSLLQNPDFKILPSVKYNLISDNWDYKVETTNENVNREKFLKELEEGKSKPKENFKKFNEEAYSFKEITITEEDIEMMKRLSLHYEKENIDDEEAELVYKYSGGIFSGVKRPFGNSDITADISDIHKLWEKDQEMYIRNSKVETEEDEDDLYFQWLENNEETLVEYLYSTKDLFAVILDRSHLGTKAGTYILQEGHWVLKEEA